MIGANHLIFEGGGGGGVSEQEFFQVPQHARIFFDTKHCPPVAAGFFFREIGLQEMFFFKKVSPPPPLKDQMVGPLEMLN